MSGQIKIFCGPMFSGKTLEAHRYAERYELAGAKSLSLMSNLNARDKGFTSRTAKDGQIQLRDALKVDSLAEATEEAKNAKVIVIDELQFLEIEPGEQSSSLKKAQKELATMWNWMREDKIVVAAGLNMFANGSLSKIIKLAPTIGADVVTLNAVCRDGKCAGDKAAFTALYYPDGSRWYDPPDFVLEKDIAELDGDIKFMAVCELDFNDQGFPSP